MFLIDVKAHPGTRAALAALLLGAPASAGAAPKLDESNRRLSVVCVEFVPYLLSKRKAGCAATAVRGGRSFGLSYNRLGLRDNDYGPRPEPGKVRIVFTGGSMVTGSGIEEPASPPRAFERALRKRGVPAEVINASGEGYIGWQNAVRTPEFLDAYAPHAVVYHLASHYVFADRAVAHNLLRKDGTILGRMGPIETVPRRMRPYFLRHRFVPRLLWYYAEQWRRVKASRRLARAAGPEALLADLMEPTLEELRQMAAACRARGVRLFVAFDGDELNADQFLAFGAPALPARLAQRFLVKPFRVDGAAAFEALRREGEKSGFSVVSLAADAERLKRPENLLPGDYHWNEQGSELFGEAAARELAADARFPRRAAPAKKGAAGP